MDCKRCINYFEVVVQNSYGTEFDISYCKYNISQKYSIVKCPMYKPKAEWKKADEQIKEEPKHIKRINRQRPRFDAKKAQDNGKRR